MMSDNRSATKVLQLPAGQQVGTLFARSLNSQPGDGWTELGSVQGEVEVSANYELKLKVNFVAADGLHWLAKLTPDSLQALDLQGLRLPDEQLVHLAHFTGLHSLNLANNLVTLTGLRFIHYFAGLRDLNLSQTPVKDDIFPELSTHSNLELLNLELTGVAGYGLEALAALSHLRVLNLGNTYMYTRQAAAVGKIAYLEELSLHATAVEVDIIQHLKLLPHLYKLNLFHLPLGEDAGARLAELPNLENLKLRQSGITDVSVKDLARLPRLGKLDVSKNVKITNAIFDCLAGHPALKVLIATETQVDSLATIYKAKLPFLEILEY